MLLTWGNLFSVHIPGLTPAQKVCGRSGNWSAKSAIKRARHLRGLECDAFLEQ